MIKIPLPKEVSIIDGLSLAKKPNVPSTDKIILRDFIFWNFYLL